MLTPEEPAKAEEEARLHDAAADRLEGKRGLQGCGCLLVLAGLPIAVAFPPALLVIIPLMILLGRSILRRD